jgi:hypothetical protein
MSGDNPWLVDYQGNWARDMEVNAVVKQCNAIIEDYEKKIQAWKKHSEAQERDFNEAIKQRNQRECQAFAWRDTMKKLVEKHGLDKEEINAMYDEIRNSYYELTRAAGKPV